MQITESRTTTNIDQAWSLDAFSRRALDVIAAALGLLLLWPVFAAVAIAIKRDTPGPVFYRGPRVGRGGREFGILKFRTMYERPESYQGARVTAAGDSRITPLGQWLRDSKLNELPQLWNVLVGDMALVGPRPEDPQIAAAWPEDARAELLSVRPGITSPAAVVYRSEEDLLQGGDLMDDYLHKILPDKLRLDRLYLRSRSLLTDLDVILMTLALLLPTWRRRQVPNAVLFWGPLARLVSRHLSWFVIDTAVAALAMGLAGLMWRLEAPLNLGPQRFLLVSLAMGLVFSLINYLIGLQNVSWRRAPASEVVPLAASAMLTVGLLASGSHALAALLPGLGWRPDHLPLSLIFIAGMFALAGFTIIRFRERLLSGFVLRWVKLRGAALGERVLLVGAGSNACFATWLMTRGGLARAFTIRGIVDDDPRKQGMDFDGVPVLGTTADIDRLVEKHDIGVLVFTISNIDPEGRARVLAACRAAGKPVVMLPDMMDELLLRFKTQADCGGAQ